MMADEEMLKFLEPGYDMLPELDADFDLNWLYNSEYTELSAITSVDEENIPAKVVSEDVSVNEKDQTLIQKKTTAFVERVEHLVFFADQDKNFQPKSYGEYESLELTTVQMYTVASVEEKEMQQNVPKKRIVKKQPPKKKVAKVPEYSCGTDTKCTEFMSALQLVKIRKVDQAAVTGSPDKLKIKEKIRALVLQRMKKNKTEPGKTTGKVVKGKSSAANGGKATEK